MRPRREKVFGNGCPLPLDRNARARIMCRARALMRRTEAGKHYGQITGKTFAVLEALLWGFQNPHTGLCFPSYASIAAKADCAQSTVGEAIKALEEAGILTWVNRITRIWEPVQDLFGRWTKRWRVIRTSNSYRFRDHGVPAERGGIPRKSSNTEIQSGHLNQELISSAKPPAPRPLDPENPLERALMRLGRAMGASYETVT